MSNVHILDSELESLKENGFVVFHDAVSKHGVEEARRGVHRAMYLKMMAHMDGDNGKNLDLGLKLAEEDVRDRTRLVDTLNKSSVLPRIALLLGGECNVQEDTVSNCPQLAVKWVESDLEKPPKPPGEFQHGNIDFENTTCPHIDGCFLWKTSEFVPFTVLVMIALTDMPDDYCGNLVVYPGSHRTICDQFTDNYTKLGYLWSRENQHSIPTGENTTVHPLNGIKPQQLHLKAGDAVVMHYLLAHSVVENRGCDPTMKLYWRIEHTDHRRLRNEALSTVAKDGHGNVIAPKFVLDLWSGFATKLSG
eukprot:m.268371 g.268371  ORF g.268371 m.268371 type:complete len:306 (-) comp78195_c0_seq1:124-1041(-)